MQKKVLAVHDISCVGRCSLTVALPVLSAAGISTAVIPTAVLSTHTGGFEGYHFRDLTEDIPDISAHWKTLGLTFDAVYTGYLGSYTLLSYAEELLSYYGSRGALRFVDPVMADGGKLYKGFDMKYAEGVKGLCASADIIVPNMTEACLLTGDEYSDGQYEEKQIRELLVKLTEIGPRVAFLTGVYYSDKGQNSNKLGTAWYDRETGEFNATMGDRIPGAYHGTGDVFASVLLSGIVKGLSLKQAADISVEITDNSIRRTLEDGTDIRYGVDFEDELVNMAEKIKSASV